MEFTARVNFLLFSGNDKSECHIKFLICVFLHFKQIIPGDKEISYQKKKKKSAAKRKMN